VIKYIDKLGIANEFDWMKLFGWIIVVVQDATTQAVLMVGVMNPEALEKTLLTGLVTFWSRTRNCLWTKGETSGNYLKVREIRVDCDKDTILVMVDADGPTCHTGATTCFEEVDGTITSIQLDE